jgi:hypothetical protein
VADHSPSSSAEAKNAWRYMSTPLYIFMVWCLVKHTDNFTFTHWIGCVGSRASPDAVAKKEKKNLICHYQELNPSHPAQSSVRKEDFVIPPTRHHHGSSLHLVLHLAKQKGVTVLSILEIKYRKITNVANQNQRAKFNHKTCSCSSNT